MIEYDPETIPEPLKAIRDDLLAEAHKRPVTPAYNTERRAPRYGFVANAEVTDLQRHKQLQERTTYVSLFGCCIAVKANKPFSAGTRVQVKITYNGATCEVIGRVVYSNSYGEMGIAFVRIEESHQTMLERWISELRVVRA